MARECPQPRYDSGHHERGRGRGRGGQGHHKARLASESRSKPSEVEHKESAFSRREVSDSSSNKVNSWLINSGEPRDITPNESDFTRYVKLQKPEKVAIADARVVDVVGITS